LATIAVWIADISSEAVAHGRVVHHIALGILSAASGAGITALLLLTSSVRGTVRVQNTLRATSLVGVSKVIRETLTGSSSIPLDAFGIGATRRWLAGIDDLYILYNGLALGEGISGQANVANTHCCVGDDAAGGT